MIDKAQETKLKKKQKLAYQCFMLMSAKAKKFQGGDQSMRLYMTISPQQRCFSKIATIFIRRTHNRWINQESRTNYSPRLQGNRQTHTHTYTHAHTHTHTNTHTHMHTHTHTHTHTHACTHTHTHRLL